jgi:multidrug efflux pump subunit AcrA (membrane-fusion protein)
VAAKKTLPARTVPATPAVAATASRAIKGEPATALKRSTAQAAKSSSVQNLPTRAVIERADGRRLRKIQIYFNEATATRLRLHCAREDVDMSAYVDALVEKELGLLGG